MVLLNKYGKYIEKVKLAAQAVQKDVGVGIANTLTFAVMHHPALFAYFLACHSYIFFPF